MSIPNSFIIKDSGNREEFKTGARRDIQEDKPRYDLIPPLALKRVAMQYKRGIDKYGEHNWVKGIPASRCYASLLRHVFAFGEGETSEDHLSAIVFNAMAIIHFQEAGRLDMLDMFKWSDNKEK